MLWQKTGATYYNAHLRLKDKGCACKGMVVCNNWNVSAYGPLLLSTIPRGMKNDQHRILVK